MGVFCFFFSTPACTREKKGMTQVCLVETHVHVDLHACVRVRDKRSINCWSQSRRAAQERVFALR